MDQGSSDRELLESWKAGDNVAGQLLFDRHFPAISMHFATKVRNESDRDDLIQRTFMGCVETIANFRGDSTFQAYLFGIARNKLREYYRSRHRQRFDPMTQSVAELQGDEPSLTAAFRAHRDYKVLFAALRRLSLEEQTLIELHYIERLKIRELVVIFDMPDGTIKSNLRRSRKKLRAECEALGATSFDIDTTLNNLERWSADVKDQWSSTILHAVGE